MGSKIQVNITLSRKSIICNSLVIILILFLLVITRSVWAGDLSCTVTTNCSSGVVIFKIQNTSNSHAGTADGSSYTNLVCCTSAVGLGNSCSGIYTKVLRLSGGTNAHAEQNSLSNPNYDSNSACISVSSGDAPTVGYVAGDGNCTVAGYDTTLASMSGATNAHVGNTAAYTSASNYKICASVSSIEVVSITITTDGSVVYGTMGQNATKSTLPGEANDLQTVKNDGYITEKFNIKGQNSANWTLSATAGNNQYIHRFCNDTDLDCTTPPTNYTALTTNYQTLAANVAANGTVDIQLQINTPNPSTVFTQQSVDVIIQAVQQ